jgi:hypothetical protein
MSELWNEEWLRMSPAQETKTCIGPGVKISFDTDPA